MAKSHAKLAFLARPEVRLHSALGEDGTGLQESLLTKEAGEASRQGVNLGTQSLPFDVGIAGQLQLANPHHARCIHAKVGSTVGLGFVKDKPSEPPPDPMRQAQDLVARGMDVTKALAWIEKATPFYERRMAELRKEEKFPVRSKLDPLCRNTFQDLILDVTEDYWQTGNGYIEVIRDGNEITGLWHIPTANVRVHVEDYDYNFHFEITDEGPMKRFAAFGDLALFSKRNRRRRNASLLGNKLTSEVIHFRRSTSLSRWYGFADHFAAAPYIELVQCRNQYHADFFRNLGVPEVLVSVLKDNVPPKQWQELQDNFLRTRGFGKQRKSMLLNLSGPDVEVQVDKLALESKSDNEAAIMDSLALSIVSAHGVPPLLAGIVIPGKLGATNELPNALLAFQTLVIGPAQNAISSTLDRTLGDAELNGGLGLSVGDFEFRSILEKIDVGAADTLSRMREPIASVPGRDLHAGLKD